MRTITGVLKSIAPSDIATGPMPHEVYVEVVAGCIQFKTRARPRLRVVR
jgi:hypothetical protein